MVLLIALAFLLDLSLKISVMFTSRFSILLPWTFPLLHLPLFLIPSSVSPATSLFSWDDYLIQPQVIISVFSIVFSAALAFCWMVSNWVSKTPASNLPQSAEVHPSCFFLLWMTSPNLLKRSTRSHLFFLPIIFSIKLSQRREYSFHCTLNPTRPLTISFSPLLHQLSLLILLFPSSCFKTIFMTLY